MFSDELGMELKCHGCKTDNLFVNCAQCTIRPCAKEKDLERCIDCPDYPCQIYGALKFAVEKLPHWSMAAANVETIKNKGAEKWLEEQSEQWKCPDCQTDYTWYGTHCSNCGKDLGDIKKYKNSFDKSIFQMKMPDPDEMFKKESVFKLEGMDQVTIQKDIAYSKQGSDLLLDLYLPPDHSLNKKLPTVVLVHGDAPVSSLKNSGQYTSLGRAIAASGLSAAAFNHRTFMQGAELKDILGDIENLLSFLIDNADEYGLDKNCMAIWSFSAGVPFGLYAGLNQKPPYIKCMAAYYGFSEFIPLYRLLNMPVDGDVEKFAEEYSPVKLLAQNPDKTAPLLIARAGMDIFPGLLDSLDGFIIEALKNNINIDVYNHPSGMHAFDLFNDELRTHEIIEKTLDFLKKHLSEEPMG
jgi:acetyl esterase/lipase